MKKSISAIFILFSIVIFGQNGASQAPKIAIKIPQGETVVVKGISVKFMEVLEDSRCPEGLTCIWAGRVKIKVAVTANGKTEYKTLIFGEVRPGEEKSTNLYSTAAFEINGIKLNTYPTATTKGIKEQYTLLIYEEKNQ